MDSLTELGEELYAKLAKAGLVPERESATLSGFLTRCIDARKDYRPNTVRNMRMFKNRILAYFGENRSLRDITPGQADEWRKNMVNEGLATATISKTVKLARQWFKMAVRLAACVPQRTQNPPRLIACGDSQRSAPGS